MKILCEETIIFRNYQQKTEPVHSYMKKERISRLLFSRQLVPKEQKVQKEQNNSNSGKFYIIFCNEARCSLLENPQFVSKHIERAQLLPHFQPFFRRQLRSISGEQLMDPTHRTRPSQSTSTKQPKKKTANQCATTKPC